MTQNSALLWSRGARALRVIALGAAMLAPGAAMAQSSFDLVGTVRDFRMRTSPGGHPDFQWQITGHTPGMVGATLPLDHVPVFVGPAGYGGVTSAATFDQWYRDVPGVNTTLSTTLTMNKAGSVWRYQNNDFFPIDNQGFGNEGLGHNFAFTMYVPAAFQYQAGANQVLTYAGDDDLWLYVNGKLVVDLGGVHPAMSQTINMDTLAGALGLVDGATVPMDIFFAERHTQNSTILIETSFVVVPTPGALALVGMGLLAARRRRRG